MRPLPFTAWPRLWTWRLAPDIPICLFAAVFIFGAGHGKNWSYYVVLTIFTALAVGWPVWLCSRTLTAFPDGVTYRPFFGVVIAIPYNQIQEMRVDRRILGTASGGSITEYTVRIIGSHGRQIKLAMDAYRTVDLRVVAQEIADHAEHVRLKRLARQLVDGREAFVRSYRPQR